MHLILGVSAYTYTHQYSLKLETLKVGCLLHRFERVSLVFVLLLTNGASQLLVRHTEQLQLLVVFIAHQVSPRLGLTLRGVQVFPYSCSDVADEPALSDVSRGEGLPALGAQAGSAVTLM